MTGMIKRLVREKYFGFIRDDAGGEYFFHASALKNIPFEELEEGKTVTFTATQGDKGPRAEDVSVA